MFSHWRPHQKTYIVNSAAIHNVLALVIFDVMYFVISDTDSIFTFWCSNKKHFDVQNIFYFQSIIILYFCSQYFYFLSILILHFGAQTFFIFHFGSLFSSDIYSLKKNEEISDFDLLVLNIINIHPNTLSFCCTSILYVQISPNLIF